MTELVQALQQLIRGEVRAALKEVLAESSASAEYLTTGEAAALAKVAPGTIRRWTENGLPHVFAGRELRILKADIEAFMVKSASSGKFSRRRRGLAGGRKKEPSPEELAMQALGFET